MSEGFRSFLVECKRVLTITRKPTKQEYWTIAKITGLGLVLIGLTGWLVSLLRLIV